MALSERRALSSRRGNSERHSALDRMRERRARRGDEDEFAPPAGAMSARPSSRPSGERVNRTPRREPRDESPPPRSALGRARDRDESPPPRSALDAGLSLPPPQAHAPCSFSPEKPPSSSGRAPHSARVRGPATVRAARGERDEPEEALPKGVANANFGTLQEMISKGIVAAEKDASSLENRLVLEDCERELARHREAMRQRREAEEAQKKQEREKAKRERQRAYEERKRRMEEELNREEALERERRQEVEMEKQQIQREFKAAQRIQSRVRGRRSRAGAKIVSPVVVGKLHPKPISSVSTAASSRATSPTNAELLA